MFQRGFIFLDLICALIISSIFIPVLFSSIMHIIKIQQSIISSSTHLFSIKNSINSVHSSADYNPSGLFLNKFYLFQDQTYLTPIFWIHNVD